MKEVYVGCNQFEAQLIKGRLEDAGIEACLLNEYLDNILPYASGITSLRLRVVVADEQYDSAIEVLGVEREDSLLHKCPCCGSEGIVYGLKGPTRFGKIFLAIISALSMSGVGKVRCNYYCDACKETF